MRELVLAALYCLVLTPQAQGPSTAFRNIPTPALDGAAEPNLAVDSRGRVWLSWLEPKPGGGHRFRAATLAGTRWSQPATIAEGTNFVANWADFPSLFIAADGTVAAHWLEYGESRSAYGIRIRTSRDNGRTWTPAVSPHAATPGEHGFASFFDAPGGGIGFAWLDGRDVAGHGSSHGAMAIRTTTLRSGKPGDETLLDAKVCDCCQTSATRTSEGVLLAYRDRSDGEIRDTSVVRLVNGKWSAPQTIGSDNWNITGCPVNGPAAAAIGDSVAVAWFTAQGDAPRTMVAFSRDAGRTFGTPIRATNTSTFGRLAMVMPAAGRVLISSLERTGTGTEGAFVMREVRSDGQVGAPVTIAPASTGRTSGFARLVRSKSNVIAAWTDVRPGAATAVRTAIAEVR